MAKRQMFLAGIITAVLLFTIAGNDFLCVLGDSNPGNGSNKQRLQNEVLFQFFVREFVSLKIYSTFEMSFLLFFSLSVLFGYATPMLLRLLFSVD